MQKSGFTLIELSIVLVIIGLIIGGVLGGRELIHSAELNRIKQDEVAIGRDLLVFKEKYGSWPGDLTNANAYWPGCLDIPSYVFYVTAPCNGNGDGRINNYEGNFVFAQLALAGIYPGKFAPWTLTSNNDDYSKVNPATPVGGWLVGRIK